MWKRFFGRKYFFNSRSNFAKSRSAIYSISSKAFMIKKCNAITTKNEFSLYRKSRENRAEKKWIRKINKITQKPSRGSFVKQTVGTVYLTEPGKGDVCTQNTFHTTCSCDFRNGPRELHCRNIFYITETTAESPCSRANFPLQLWLYSTRELFQNLKRPKLISISA